MTRVLDLADMLELIDDRLDERALAQEQFVTDAEQAVAHVRAQLGDELKALCQEELLGEVLGDVATVTKELAEEPTNQARQRSTIVDIAGCEAEGEELAAVIDDQVQLEAVELAHRGLAAARLQREDAMLANAQVLADGQRRRVDEADVSVDAQLGVQIDDQRRQDAGQ